MSMMKEFRDFAARGNVIDLAVGVIIGAAFGKVVASAVADLIMPPIGMALGRVDFANFFVSLNGTSYPSREAAKAAGAPTINYGLFINTCLDFAIVAFAVFLLVKEINRLKNKMAREAPPASPAERNCPLCLTPVPILATKCKACTADLPPA